MGSFLKWGYLWRRRYAAPGLTPHPTYPDIGMHEDETQEETGALYHQAFRLPVDYGKSREEMISAGGYTRKNCPRLLNKFPIEEGNRGIVEFEARYFWLDQKYLSKEAVLAVEREGGTPPWTPAGFEHMLAHGELFPKRQRKFPIVGLGSVVEEEGARYVSYLTCLGEGRCLYAFPLDGYWSEKTAILVVRRLREIRF